MTKTFDELHKDYTIKTIEMYDHEAQMLNKHTITRKDLSVHTDLAFEIADLHADMMSKFMPQPTKLDLLRKLFQKN